MFLHDALIPKLLNSTCFLFFNKSLFLLPHVTHFDNSFVLPFLVFKTLEFIFSVFFYTLNNMIALLYT